MIIENIGVNVTCTSENITEGSVGSYSTYRIQSVAEYRNYGSIDYASRRVEMKVGLP